MTRIGWILVLGTMGGGAMALAIALGRDRRYWLATVYGMVAGSAFASMALLLVEVM